MDAFKKSNKTQRSPPKVQPLVEERPDFNCKSCNKPDSSEMVQCDECDAWFHFSCVGVTKEIENIAWSCEECMGDEKADNSDAQTKHNEITSQISGDIIAGEEKTQSTNGKSVIGGVEKKSNKTYDVSRQNPIINSDGNIVARGAIPKKRIVKQPKIDTPLVSNKLCEKNLKYRGHPLGSQSNIVYKSPISTNTSSFQVAASSNVINNSEKRIDTLFSINSTSFPFIRPGSDFITPHSSYHTELRKSVVFQDDQVKNVHEETKSLSNVSRSSSIGGKLALKKLEEEKELQLKQIQLEREYIEQKYKLLEEMASSKGSVQDNESVTTSGSHRTLNWVLSQNTVAQAESKNAFNNSSKLYPNTTKSNDGSKIKSRSPSRKDHTITNEQMAARQVVSRELPIFDGNPSDWPLFICSYYSSTQSCGFNNADNLSRLQKCLKGKALHAVKSSLLLPSSVPDVIETLEMFFGRPELIVYESLSELKSSARIPDQRLELIVPFALKVKNMTNTMQALGLIHHLSNPDTILSLVGKLPSYLKAAWGDFQQNTPNPNLLIFSKWLMRRAISANSVSGPESNIKRGEENKSSKFKATNTFLHAAHTLKGEAPTKSETSSPDLQTTPKKLNCKICHKAGHFSVDCPKFLSFDVKKRWSIITRLRMCVCCLGPHFIRDCDKVKLCLINGCDKKHHQLLHKNRNPDQQVPLEENNKEVATVSLNAYQLNKLNVVFRIIPVVLHGKGGSFHTFAFLDEGSSLTLIEESMARLLQLDGSTEALCLKWTGNTTRQEHNSKRVSLTISGQSPESKKFKISNVRTVAQLNLPMQTLTKPVDEMRTKHLKNLPISWYENAVPTILIGLQHWQLCLPLEVREGCWGEPAATKTRLGWTVSGPLNDHFQTNEFVNFHMCGCNQDLDLHKLVKEFFTTESFGVKAPEKSLESKENERARVILDTKLIRVGERFESPLLWRYDQINLPNSKFMAERRFHCLERKMLKDENLGKKLTDTIREYVTEGYIRKLTVEEAQKITTKTWYLPIFAVSNPNKPSKVRIVWDAAATVEGISLNSMLLTGPDLLVALPTILYKFRERKVAICGDIKQMFHQVLIKKEDQEAQRFLWRDHGKIETYVMMVMTFGATCSPCVAQYVKNKNALEFSNEYPRASLAICERHYVDDWLDSFDSVDETVRIAQEVRLIHSKGGFEIRNWLSNSTQVLNELGEHKPHLTKNLMCKEDEGNSAKILGMWWNASNDEFYFAINYERIGIDITRNLRVPTKREVLRALMLIFDPLGLIAFYLVYGKMILQDIWKSAIDWDDPIGEVQQQNWKRWTKFLPAIENLRIPRCYNSTNLPEETKFEMHIFVDASNRAFAAVAYFRIVSNSIVSIRLVAAKTKIAPTNPLSIPRLELQAAVLGARLANNVMSSHSINISRKVFWSDSMDVLYWLRSESRKFQQFVAHRVGEILECTNVSEWRWIPSKENVADEATKWKRDPDISSNSRWFTGPEFLRKNEHDWPVEKSTDTPLEIFDELVEINIHQSNMTIVVPDPMRFSSWTKMIRTQVYVLRVFDRLKKRRTKFSGIISMEELKAAELDLYRMAQRDNYGEEISLLLQKKNIHKSSSIYKLSPFLDNDQVLRMKGRLENSNFVPFDTKNPVILSRKHKITSLIILNYHIQYLHGNNETVVNELRQKYVIPNLRVAVKNIVYNCQKCKNRRAKPTIPEMAVLPKARLSCFTRPFTYVGVDYFGPLEVAVGRHVEKRWGALFTCLTIRAVHTEVAYSLSSDSFIMVLRNFIARRGCPIEVFSDNGTNFKGTCTELNEFITTNLSPKLSENFPNIKWNFLPPNTPHMGGVWERLVRSIKTNLKVALPTRHPTDELLRCCLAEIDNIVNSRPLTYIPTDSSIENEALTPNHFLLGSSSGMKPFGEFNDDVLVLRKKWKIAQRTAEMFWKRWIREYMPTIARRTKWFEKTKPIAVGDLVVIMDEAKVNSWVKGVVKEVKESGDGQVRQVIVETAKGSFLRSVAKVAVLDITDTSKSSSTEAD